MDFTLIASVASITVICYLVGLVAKNTPLDNKWIPSVVGIVGMVLGIVGRYVIADFPAQDVLSACAVGIVSGLASTGADQVWRQTHPSDKGRITVLAHEDTADGDR